MGWVWYRQTLAIIALGSFALAGGCREEAASTVSDGSAVPVFVSIPPQKYFVARVGGPHVRVSVLVPPGQSHHTYEPTPRQMVDLSRARAFFCIGLPFERQVVGKVGAAVKSLHVVETQAGIELAPNPDAHHEHDHDHAECDEELDLHVWMSPRLVKIQARNIAAELIRLDPEHAADYERNLAAFEADLDDVDARIAAALAPLKGREFYVFHPAFGYFAEAYGLRQVAVETGGKQPTARQLGRLIDRARESGVKLIFVQPQFARQSAEAVAQAIGGAVVPLDPLAEDYLNNLLDVAAKVQEALGQPADTIS